MINGVEPPNRCDEWILCVYLVKGSDGDQDQCAQVVKHLEQPVAVEESSYGYHIHEDKEYKFTRNILNMLKTWHPGPALSTTVYDWPIRVVKGMCWG